MEISGLQMELIVVKVVWRSVSTMNGEQCVARCGIILMLLWSVDNSNLLQVVTVYRQFFFSTSFFFSQ